MEFNTLTSAGVRVFHAATKVKPVDIYLNDQLVISNLMYSEASEYLPVTKGKYNVKIYESETGTLLYNQTITIDGDKFITLSAISDTNKIELIVVEDSALMPNRFGDITDLFTNGDRQASNQAKIRFIHLSPNAPAVDLTLSDGTILFANTKYKQASDYLPIAAGTKTLQVRPTGTKQVVLSVPNVIFDPNTNYTVYAIGMLNGNPKLEAIVLIDGVLS